LSTRFRDQPDSTTFDVDIRSGIHQWNDSFKAGQKSGSTALFDWPAFLVIRKRPRQSATDRAYTAKHSTPGTVSPPHSVAPLPPHRDSVDALNGAQRAGAAQFNGVQRLSTNRWFQGGLRQMIGCVNEHLLYPTNQIRRNSRQLFSVSSQ